MLENCSCLFSSVQLSNPGVIHTSHSLPFDSTLAGSSAWGSPNKASMQASISIMPLNGLVADIMVPKSEDQAALRNNAMSNRLVPHAYGASLFPIEPESSLSFDMEPWVAKLLVVVVVVVVATFF